MRSAIKMSLVCWEQRFPNCVPVAHRLRTTFAERWVRLHSLPGSKRYPENEDEYATVLSRHNRIMGDLACSGRGVIFLSTGYSDSPEPVRLRPELVSLDPEARPWRSVPMHDPEEESARPCYWHVYASAWEWQPGTFDPMIRLVADDGIANIMILSPSCEWLLHPYDGGTDLIVASSEIRDRLKSTYFDWLSPRPDGL